MPISNGDLTDEIKRLLDNNHLDDSEVMKLLLVMVSKIQKDVSSMAYSNEQIIERIKDIERFNERYPPLMFMLHKDTKRFLVVMIMVFLIYTVIVSPWMISDIRHVVLHFLGLPADLGLTVP